MSSDDLAPLRARAYQLADTGRYEDWASLSADLVDEGALEVVVRRLVAKVEPRAALAAGVRLVAIVFEDSSEGDGLFVHGGLPGR